MNFLGIDIGGTKMAISIASEQGDILVDQRFPTDPNNPQPVMDQAVEVINELLDRSGFTIDQIETIGISSPGPMCSKRRMVLNTPNMKGWNGFRVGDFLEKKFGRPVFMQNDANGAGLAEYLFGAQKGKDLVYLTMSTGIGAGVVIGGNVLHGTNDLGGEIGHWTLDINGPLCGCGKTGCWEAYCGGKSMAKHLRDDIVANSIQTSILDEAGGAPEKINMQAVRAALRAGDVYAVEKWDVFIEKMAQAVAMVLHAYNPQAITMGTLAIHGGDTFIPQMIERLPKYAWKGVMDVCTIEATTLENIGELAAIAVALDGYNHLKKG